MSQENIWSQLAKPIFCLAPMEDVTDTAFRQLLCEIGKPPLMFTEFTNVQSIYSHAKDVKRLEYTLREQPLIAQFWGIEPELYYLAAQLAADLGFAGIDINFGCPQPKIVKKGACSAVINDFSLASEIIEATFEGAAGKIPVSVKTRIGFATMVTDEWASHLLQYPLAALTIHGRTAKQLSKVPANWDEVSKVVSIRDQKKSNTLIIGNGDVLSIEQAQSLVDQHRVDGVMIGRGIFQNPWLFSEDPGPRSKEVRLTTLLRHVELWEQEWSGQQPFHKLRRFFKIYASGFDGASELRTKLMTTTNAAETRELIAAVLV